MKDIFSDIYDRVLSFFTTQAEDDTKLVAKNRLRTVLMQDRVGFSERAMQMLKDDMLESISRYLEIDVSSFNLSIDANETATILNFSIPVLRPKTDEEIDEALSIQEKAKIERTHEIVGELKELVKEKAQELAEQIQDGEVEVEEESEAKEETEAEEIEEKTEAKVEKPIKSSTKQKAKKAQEIKQ